MELVECKLFKVNAISIMNRILLFFSGLLLTITVFPGLQGYKKISIILSTVSLVCLVKTKIPDTLLGIVEKFNVNRWICMVVLATVYTNFQIDQINRSAFYRKIVETISNYIHISDGWYHFIFFIFCFYFIFQFLVWFYFMFLYATLWPLIKRYYNINKKHTVNIIIVLMLILFVFIVLNCFTNIFYNPTNMDGKHLNNAIHHMDTYVIYEKNDFINLNGGNPLRQILYGTFTAPLVLPVYIIADIFLFVPNLYPSLLMLVQTILVFLIGIMLYDLVKNTLKYPKLFIIFYSVTYSTLIFTFPIERFVYSTFYLVLFIHTLINNSSKWIQISAYVIGLGTLTTTGTIGLAILDYSSISKLKKSIKYGLYAFLIFFFFASVLAKTYQFLDLKEYFGGIDKYSADSSFAYSVRIFHFLNYICGCFIMPSINSGVEKYEQIDTNLSAFIGLIIVIICFISFVKTPKNRFTNICALVVVNSIIVLVFWGLGMLGDGTLILYGLSFGFPYIYFFYNFLEKSLENLKNERIEKRVLSVIILGVAIINIYGLIDIIRFGIKYYPFT